MYKKRLILSNHWGNYSFHLIQSSDSITCWVIFTSFNCFSCSCCCCSACVTRTGLYQNQGDSSVLKWHFLYLFPRPPYFYVFCVLDGLSAVCMYVTSWFCIESNPVTRYSFTNFYLAWQHLQYFCTCFTFLLFYQMGSVYSSTEREFKWQWTPTWQG